MLMYSIISSIIISFSKKERIYQISIKRREIKSVKKRQILPQNEDFKIFGKSGIYKKF
jgi:hypothetical protein